MTCPNGSDSIPLEDLLSEIKDNKVEIPVLTLMAIISDLHWFQGRCEGLEWAVNWYKEKEAKRDLQR